MRSRTKWFMGILLALSLPACAQKKVPTSFHDLSAEDIDHRTRALSEWRGKVLLVVNVASRCGNTPQYAGLEALYREFKARDFAILGFPSNDFGGQEPGTEEEIKTFCSTKYQVTFPMFAKISTQGYDQSPVYRFLTSDHGFPTWNFHKYLVGRDGKVIASFDAKVPPNSPELRAQIEAALKI